MTDDSNLEPKELDDVTVAHAEGEVRGDHELDDVDAALDEADRDVRIDATEGDDLPYSPPDLQPRASEREMAGIQGEETIEQRIMQEEPDPTSAYGAPDDEGGLEGLNAGGDDPDAIPESQDFVGGPGVITSDAADSGELTAEQEAMHVEDQGI